MDDRKNRRQRRQRPRCILHAHRLNHSEWETQTEKHKQTPSDQKLNHKNKNNKCKVKKHRRKTYKTTIYRNITRRVIESVCKRAPDEYGGKGVKCTKYPHQKEKRRKYNRYITL